MSDTKGITYIIEESLMKTSSKYYIIAASIPTIVALINLLTR